MRLPTFLIALFLLITTVVLFSYFQRQKIPLKELKPEETLLAFGDSLTYGYGAYPNESYPVQLEKQIDRRVVNAGIPGELSDEGVKRLPPLLEKYHPDILILCHGGNDILQKKSKRLLQNNIENMIRQAQIRHIDVILIGVPELSILSLHSLPMYQESAEKYHLPIDADILPSLLHDNRYKSDWIHPNANGYKKMAEAIEKLLRDHYELKERQ